MQTFIPKCRSGWRPDLRGTHGASPATERQLRPTGSSTTY